MGYTNFMKLPKDRFFIFCALLAGFILLLGLLATLFAPPATYGAEGDFVPLVSVPNVNYSTGSLTDYVNSVFSFIISLAAMLAVLRIVTGGFKYMTSEAIGAKGDARETIQGAVFGLILLLGSWLILYTVNPQILDLSALQFTSLQQEGEARAYSDAQKAERERRLQEFVDRGEMSFLSEGAAKDAARECRNRGGVSSDVRRTTDQEALQNCLRYSTRDCYPVSRFDRWTVTCSK